MEELYDRLFPPLYYTRAFTKVLFYSATQISSRLETVSCLLFCMNMLKDLRFSKPDCTTSPPLIFVFVFTRLGDELRCNGSNRYGRVVYIDRRTWRKPLLYYRSSDCFINAKLQQIRAYLCFLSVYRIRKADTTFISFIFQYFP